MNKKGGVYIYGDSKGNNHKNTLYLCFYCHETGVIIEVNSKFHKTKKEILELRKEYLNKLREENQTGVNINAMAED